MKHLLFLLTAFLLATSFSSITAQDEGNMNDEAMKAWQEYMTPGPMHELLAKGVGEWKTEIKSWMDPNMPPSVTEGKSVCESILGGRYFQTVETSKFMDMPFEGHGLFGYDNATKKFFGTWIDNFGTGVMNTEGTYDEATKTFNYTGSGVGPTGEYKVREISKYIDDDHSHFEMYMTEGEKPEMKTMEIEYTRIK